MAEKVTLPCEFKYDYAMRGYVNTLRAWLYVTREEYGAATALKLYEKVCKIDDRAKGLTNTILKIFKLEGNDVETIGQWFDIWFELCGMEYTWLELSKTRATAKITKCVWKTGYKDLSGWCSIWLNIIGETINPKATFEQPKRMCAGDPYCELVFKIEE